MSLIAGSRSSALISLALAGLVFFIDRAHKFYQVDLAGWTGGERIQVTPFFDYVLLWNTGISYGMLSGVPTFVLAMVIGLAMALLIGWWIKAEGLRLRLALAFCLGGAVSNALDRVFYGAVADFFHFYSGTWSFYVFNIADMAITTGAILLIIDLLFAKPEVKA